MCRARSFQYRGGVFGQSLPVGATEQARELHATWVVFFRAGLGVMVVVYGRLR
ncbi:MAG: hypothetical protein ACLPYS_10475 [Vulcanimicrobiaceae bacterium]